MEVTQIYELMNTVTEEVTGQTDLVAEDLSNVVQVGEEIFGATAVDNYVKTLVNHIGRVIFVNRAYEGNAPSVLRDGWEFGSVLEKIRGNLPDAVVNESWELEDGRSYDPNVFVKPDVAAKFFNGKVTFEVDISITELQVKESFSNAQQLNGFLSMLTNEVSKSITIKLDALIMRTINSMTADTLFDAFGAAPTDADTSVRAINLLKGYNDTLQPATPLTKELALTTPEFIRYACLQMKLLRDRMKTASTLFNMGGNVRFTSDSLLHVVMLSEFAAAADVYLQSDTYNEQYTALPNAETVAYWQGSGLDFGFDSTSKINVVSGNGNAMEADGILGVMFDHDALGVCNKNSRVTSNYNPKAEFTNYFYKEDGMYFTDGDENYVVFFIA